MSCKKYAKKRWLKLKGKCDRRRERKYGIWMTAFERCNEKRDGKARGVCERVITNREVGR